MRSASLLLLGLGIAGALPDSAPASAVVAFEGSVATYTGASAEAHTLVVSSPTGVIEFKEPGVIAGSACMQVASDKVHCPRAVATGIKVVLGSQDDSLDAVKAIDLPVEVNGNDGDDVIRTGAGSDTLRGGAGNDRFEPGNPLAPGPGEANTMVGGDGDDTFVLGRSLGADTVIGGNSMPGSPLRSTPPPDTAGVDTADYSARPLELGGVAVSLGGGGPVVDNAFAASDGRFDGSEGDDLRMDIERLIGTPWADALAVDRCDTDPIDGSAICFRPAATPRVDGGAGNDALSGDRLDEELLGGIGNDSLEGFRGDDALDGGPGNDVLVGGPLSAAGFFADVDALEGGSGNDNLRGGVREDTLDGGTGNDVMSGGPGDDDLAGGIGDDSMHGDAGDDGVAGGEGIDTVNGDAGKDRLHGDGGDDTLAGGDDDDDVFADAGRDTAGGGSGADDIFLRDGIADRCFVPSSGSDDIDADLADQPIFEPLCGVDPVAPPTFTVGFSPVDELPSVRIRTRRLTVRRGRVTVPLACPRARRRYACAGRATLADPRGRPVLARARYRVRAGRRGALTLRMPPSGRRLRAVRLTLVGRGRSRKGPTTVHAFLRVRRPLR
jgi:hypothetical protein